MRLLQAVLDSTPDISLVGLDVFDRKYSKLRIQDAGLKNCIRSLLARGMHLGSQDRPPHSKLLRKIEADAEPLWVQRWLDAMLVACPHLPESVGDRIWELLGLDKDSD